MTHISYNKKLTELARRLRNNSTLGEIMLWKRLSGKKCCGLQFNRQKPLGKYIVDFYCKSANLVIEIDGSSHNDEQVRHKDKQRQADLESMGLTVLRFTEGEARNSNDNILKAIEYFIEVTNPPNPLFKGEKYAPNPLFKGEKYAPNPLFKGEENQANYLFKGKGNLLKHIYLCGFMGSGKTTVGLQLAKKLNYVFLDTDSLIEKKETKKIHEIFEKFGESKFRKLENAVIKEILASKEKIVIALGGGSLIRKENLKLIKKNGFLIYLKTELKTISKRIPSDPSRPLLKEASLESLFAIRQPSYEKADFIVETDRKSPAEIVETICSHFRIKSNR
jgi:shikimate kinase/very-short-patch-repair endonuclease